MVKHSRRSYQEVNPLDCVSHKYAKLKMHFLVGKHNLSPAIRKTCQQYIRLDVTSHICKRVTHFHLKIAWCS